MKPIYFPFTYLSDPVVKSLSACFRQTVVYQPSGLRIPVNMRRWADSGVLDIRVPVTDHEDKLAAVLKDYEDWATLFKQGGLDYLKVRRDIIPFFDENASSRIRADIKKKARGNQMQDEAVDLLNARVFLHMAQEFDLQNDELGRNLLTLEAMEQDFISDLKGQDEALQPQADTTQRLQTGDPGIYMTAERLKAWIDIRQQDTEASGLYITTSRSVFDELIDYAPEAEMIVGFDAVPVYEERSEEIEQWQAGLFEALKMLLTNPRSMTADEMQKPPAASGYERAVSIKFFIIPKETPANFFARCIQSDPLPIKDKQKEAAAANVIVGMIEF